MKRTVILLTLLLLIFPCAALADNATASLTDSIETDADFDGEADRGDTIQYDLTVTGTGAGGATSVVVNGDVDVNQTFVPGSLMVGPIALDDSDSLNVNDNVEVDVLANDRDVDGTLDPATVTVTSAPAEGNTAVNTTTGAITYTSTGMTGPDSFTYTVDDNDGLVSRDATVSIDVSSCPTAQNDAVSANEDTGASGNVLSDNGSGADSDPESDTLIVSEVNGVAANVGMEITLPSGAKLTVNSNGTFVYDTNGAFEGLGGVETDSDSFTYTLDDGGGGTCNDTATVSITISAVNDCPTAQDDADSTDEDTVLMGDVKADNGNGADTDPDTNDILSVTKVNNASFTSGVAFALPSGAMLTMNTNGSFNYDPNGQFEALNTGDMDSDGFTYTLSDGTCVSPPTATFGITIDGVNDAPAAAAQSGTTVGNVEFVGDTGGLTAAPNGSPAVTDTGVNLLTGATDVDDMTSSLSAVPATGSSANNGSFEVFADGSFTYAPPAGYTGMDTFTYQLTDGTTPSAAATVTMTVGTVLWFIDNTAGGTGGTGTSSDPFLTSGDFNTANGGGAGKPATGQRVFMFQGSGNYGGITLLQNQILHGEAVALTVDTINLVSAGTAPTISTSTANGVSLNSGNTIQGINIANTPGFFKISGGAVGNLAISTVSVSGTGGGLNIGTSGAFGSNVNFGTFESTSSPGSGINLVSVTGTLAASSFGSGISGAAASSPSVNVNGGSVSFTYGGAIGKANAGALVNVQGGHSGTLTFNTGALGATSGTGLQFNNADGTYNFSGAVTLNGGDAGIDILNGSAGTFTFSNTTITNPSGVAFNVDSSTANVNYNGGSITQNTSGVSAVKANGNTGGTIDINVAVTADSVP